MAGATGGIRLWGDVGRRSTCEGSVEEVGGNMGSGLVCIGEGYSQTASLLSLRICQPWESSRTWMPEHQEYNYPFKHLSKRQYMCVSGACKSRADVGVEPVLHARWACN